MTYDDLRAATATALQDERLRQAELGRNARRLRVEARARRGENQERIRARRA